MWQDRVAAAIKNEGFSVLDKKQAGEWFSCAVGEKLEANSNDAPESLELQKLGETFYFAVLHDNYKVAEFTLSLIHEFKVQDGD